MLASTNGRHCEEVRAERVECLTIKTQRLTKRGPPPSFQLDEDLTSFQAATGPQWGLNLKSANYTIRESKHMRSIRGTAERLAAKRERAV